MTYLPPLDKYVTCGRDGAFRVWAGKDLQHCRTVATGSSWITDAVYLPAAGRMVLAGMDNALSYYDVTR
jgi:hypothetical protein